MDYRHAPRANTRRRYRARRNPYGSYQRNPSSGTNIALIALVAGGAFLLMGGTRLFGGMLGTPAAVPPGYTPVGNGLYRAPNGAIVARDPNTGQMVMSPAGYAPTSAEDLLTRAGISLIPTAAQGLASFISGLFHSGGSATTPIGTGPTAPGSTSVSDAVRSGSDYSFPALPPLPNFELGEVWSTGDVGGVPSAGEPDFSLWGPELPPLSDPWDIWSSSYPPDTAPGGGETYSLWGPDMGGLDWSQYELPPIPDTYQWGWETNLDLAPADVGLTVGGSDVTIFDPGDSIWEGFWGYRPNPKAYEPKYLRRPPSRS
jgi:hypothetical protein